MMSTRADARSLADDASTAERRASSLAWPIALPFLRAAAVALAALATAGVLALAGQPSGPQAVSVFAALYVLPVNVLSLVAVVWLVRREGGSLRALIGVDRARLGRDLGWGVLWLLMLYVPFAAAIMGTMLALFGASMLEAFVTVFAPDPAGLPALGLTASVVLAIVAVVTFAPLNAPAEELVYRGYSQGRLAAARPVLALLLPSLAFGLQHVVFAATIPAMLVYAVAFFVWGLGAALIYRWQGRLMPLIVAHVLVNLVTSIPALVLPFVAA